MTNKNLTYREAARRILVDRKSLHYRDLADAIIEAGLV